MRKLRIHHVTQYAYDEPAVFHPHQLLLRPREGHDVRVQSSRLSITPAHNIVWHRDINDNSVATADFLEAGPLLEVDSEVVIENYESEYREYPLTPQAQSYPFKYDSRERLDLNPYQHMLTEDGTEALAAWTGRFWAPGTQRPTLELLDDMNATISQGFTYVRREEPGVQPAAQTLALGSGSCRDLATLFLEACRHLGFAARFVSGYLYAPGFAPADSATHAWAEVYLPGAGWRGFDSTSGNHVGADHIAVAVARHPETVPPVSGTYEGGVSTLNVQVAVEQL